MASLAAAACGSVPPVYCNPTTKPPQFCPGGQRCPRCGQIQCACPGAKPPPGPPSPPASTTFRCDANTHLCAASGTGNFTNLTLCETTCTAPTPPPLPTMRFSCDQTGHWQCVERKMGNYSHLAGCQAACSFSEQCFAPYTNLSNVWRATNNENISAGGKFMGDVKPGDASCSIWNGKGTGVGGDSWYRFVGAGGTAMPLESPGSWHPGTDHSHCGTRNPGWLSGWDAQPGIKDPPCNYTTAGHYPKVVDGVKEMTVCFDESYDDPNPKLPDGRCTPGSGPYTCESFRVVGVVRCDGFMLWRLPYTESCDNAYCTDPTQL
eukprot:SAG31_NODE_5206_length_2677_cov_2.313809_2_plen_320_part_00